MNLRAKDFLLLALIVASLYAYNTNTRLPRNYSQRSYNTWLSSIEEQLDDKSLAKDIHIELDSKHPDLLGKFSLVIKARTAKESKKLSIQQKIADIESLRILQLIRVADVFNSEKSPTLLASKYHLNISSGSCSFKVALDTERVARDIRLKSLILLFKEYSSKQGAKDKNLPTLVASQSTQKAGNAPPATALE